MLAKQRRAGFTLVELLIVVVILGILATTVVPQFMNSKKDAVKTAAAHSASQLQAQIELYRFHHQGALPDGTNELAQLTSATNVAGTFGPAGPSFPFGPYVPRIPANPYTGSPKVMVFTGEGDPEPSHDDDAGWIYKPATGQIWCDHPVY
jgi:type II secretion system protein G